MTDQSSLQLTDALIEKMLAERAGRGAPADLVPSISAAVESTGQRAPGLLGCAVGTGDLANVWAGGSDRPHRGGPSRSRRSWSRRSSCGGGPRHRRSPRGRRTVPSRLVRARAIDLGRPSPSRRRRPRRHPSSVPGGVVDRDREHGRWPRRPHGDAAASGKVLVAGGWAQPHPARVGRAVRPGQPGPGPPPGPWPRRAAPTRRRCCPGKVLVAGGDDSSERLPRVGRAVRPGRGTWPATGTMATAAHRPHGDAAARARCSWPAAARRQRRRRWPPPSCTTRAAGPGPPPGP